MRDATYVVVALALCMLILLVFSLNKPKPISMLDLSDFKTLPYELRAALRRMLPDPVVIRQRWASMTPGQKQMAIQQIGGLIPQPRPPPIPQRPEEPKPEEPKPEEPKPEEPKPEEPKPEEPKPEEPKPLKKGFLNDTKKKNTNDKKKNKVVALSGVASDDNTPSGGFLGPDE